MKTLPRRWWLGMLVSSLMATQAQAGAIEDKFKAFIDALKARGQTITQGLPALGGVPEVKVATLTLRTDALPLGRKDYVVFVANGCVSCTDIVERLRRKGLPVIEVLNVSTSATAREAFGLTGAKGVPAVLVGKQLLTGYSDALAERALIDDNQEKESGSVGQGA
jgi:glutaredoxin